MANLFEVAVLVDAEAFEVLKESSAGRIEPARQMHSRATLATDAPASLGDPLKGRQRVRFHGYRHGQGSASSAVKHAVLLPVAQSHIHHNVRHGRRTTGIQRTTDVQKGTHHAGQQGGHITSDNRWHRPESTQLPEGFATLDAVRGTQSQARDPAGILLGGIHRPPVICRRSLRSGLSLPPGVYPGPAPGKEYRNM